MAPEPARVLRFGTFEVDVQTGEIRKSGREIRVQEQPRQVLLALLERPGQVITREELRQRLWPDGTFVDFEHSLNTAVKKLRDALGDAAENPRFIETVPLRGYRFTAPVAHEGGNGHRDQNRPGPRRHRRIAVVTGATVLAALAAALFSTSRPSPVPRLVGSAQLTHSGRVLAPDRREFFPALATDGARIYFSEVSDRGTRLAQVSVAGGEVLPVPLPFPGGQVLHISPDGTRLLVRKRFSLHEKEGPLWVVPTVGGAPHRIGGITAHDAAWSPDGMRIVYAQGEALFLANADGSQPQKLASARGRAVWPRWSPDGSRLRFTSIDARTNERSLWEVSADGRDPHRLVVRGTERGDECCGRLDARRPPLPVPGIQGREDGRLGGPRRAAPVRSAGLRPGPPDTRAAPLRAAPAKPRWPPRVRRRRTTPHRSPALRHGRTRVQAVRAARPPRGLLHVLARRRVGRLRRANTRRLFVVAQPARRQPARPAHTPSAPPHGAAVVPDGKRIAFMGKYPDKPWKIYSVAVEGNNPEELLDEDLNQADPNWSPDGRSVLFGRPPDYFAEPGTPKAIHVLDLKTKRLSTLAGSEGLFSPRWSPDGRFVAAMTLDQAKLMLFDFATGKWSELGPRTAQADRPFHANLPTWSPDGRLLYFQNGLEEGTPIYRVRMSDRTLERVADLGDVKRRVLGCLFTSLAQDGSPLVLCNQADSDIYALEWDAR